MDFSLATPTIPLVAPPAPLVSLTPAASSQRPALTQPTVPLVDLEYGAEDEMQEQPECGQVGGAKTQKRIKFDETECRRVLRKALLCKTFTPRDEYADLNTVLYSFREVIRRELLPILTEHPGVKAWIGLRNLYDYNNKGVYRELSI